MEHKVGRARAPVAPGAVAPGAPSAHTAMWALLVVSFIFFLENFDRYLLNVALIPYLDYSSYEYSVLSGKLELCPFQ
jgi:hypothetical protein